MQLVNFGRFAQVLPKQSLIQIHYKIIMKKKILLIPECTNILHFIFHITYFYITEQRKKINCSVLVLEVLDRMTPY